MIVGVSSTLRRAVALAERYAHTRLPILLVGATGTGKELLAKHIHERSGRPGLLVDVNCCALPRDMVESLLRERDIARPCLSVLTASCHRAVKVDGPMTRSGDGPPAPCPR